jgi:hypothetical protein
MKNGKKEWLELTISEQSMWIDRAEMLVKKGYIQMKNTILETAEFLYYKTQ